jgi:hypothetical protein
MSGAQLAKILALVSHVYPDDTWAALTEPRAVREHLEGLAAIQARLAVEQIVNGNRSGVTLASSRGLLLLVEVLRHLTARLSANVDGEVLLPRAVVKVGPSAPRKAG